MSIGNLITKLEGGHFFPDTRIVFDIAKAGVVTVDLTEVVQQGDDGYRFFTIIL